jgi:hypothetical protein
MLCMEGCMCDVWVCVDVCIKPLKKNPCYTQKGIPLCLFVCLSMTIFQFPLNISGEYFPMINDLFRMGIIQIITQLMFYFANPVENPFWSPLFLQTVMFLLIGVLVYWLIFRHIIGVVPATATPATPVTPATTATTVSSPPLPSASTTHADDAADDVSYDAAADAADEAVAHTNVGLLDSMPPPPPSLPDT